MNDNDGVVDRDYNGRIPNLRNSCCIVRVSGIDKSNGTNSNLQSSRSRSFSYSSNGKIIFSCSGFIIDLEKGLIITSPTIFLPFIIENKNNNKNNEDDQLLQINTKYSIEKILSNIDIDIILESDIKNIKNNSNSATSNQLGDDKIFDPINSWKSCRFINYLSCSKSTLNVLNQLKNHFILSNQTTGGYESSFGLIVLELIDKSVLRNSSGSNGINSSVIIGNSLEEKSGNNIYVVGSPFGFISPTMFLNSISSGIICNCISNTNSSSSSSGNRTSMFLIDARSLPGNEGSAVFNKDGLLIGIIAPPIRSKNDKLPFTLAPVLPIHCFLSKFESKLSIYPKYYLSSPSNFNQIQQNVKDQQNSIVLVQFKNSWGSGVLISENGYILTNAHLIIPSIPLIQQQLQQQQQQQNTKITTTTTAVPEAFPIELYKDKKVDIRINSNSIIMGNQSSSSSPSYNNNNNNFIWCKGSIEYISHTHLDIALIKIDLNNEIFKNSNNNNNDNDNDNNNKLIKFQHVECNPILNPKYGDDVFVLGYPLIPPTNNPPISVTKGIISNIVYVDNCAVSYQTTASVHSGNSGGGLFDLKGNFLGIVTCNAKQKNGLIITELNFSIPSTSLIHFFHYANGTDRFALNLMRSTTTDKFLKALWKLQITPPILTSNSNKNNNTTTTISTINKNNENNNNNNISITTAPGKKYSEFLTKINQEYQQHNNNNNNNNPIQSKL